VARDNRFRTTVELRSGRSVWAYLPNSGRLRELLQPGKLVFLRPVASPGRKTAFDLVLVAVGEALVSTDARLPNVLVEEAVREGRLSPFEGYEVVRREVQYGSSRLDLALERRGRRCFVEVKSVTLVRAKGNGPPSCSPSSEKVPRPLLLTRRQIQISPTPCAARLRQV
jgi:sugar fermentation stimulation protein A